MTDTLPKIEEAVGSIDAHVQWRCTARVESRKRKPKAEKAEKRERPFQHDQHSNTLH